MNKAAKMLLLFGKKKKWVPTYLLRDEFTTDAAAPLASPRTCEPGPGNLTLFQVDNLISVASGRLTIGNQATTTNGYRRVISQAIPAAAGIAFFAQLDGIGSGENRLGVHNGSGFNIQYGFGVGIQSNDIWLINYANLLGGHQSGDVYGFVYRPSGGGFIVRKRGGVIILLYVQSIPVIANLNAEVYTYCHTTYSGNSQFDSMRVTTLPAPWATDYGIATQLLAGARVAGDAFTHEANCLIGFTVTALPSDGNIDFRFRKQDDTNYWQAVITSTGAITLNEVVNGTPTQRGTAAAGTVGNGHRVVIVADGQTIMGYSNNVLAWTRTGAANFAASTTGLLADEGTGGDVRDIASWPRVIDGAAKNLLITAITANP